ncbi:MAG: hypothetical protein IPI35_07695 [Deltaproteobacteria bacterium]|nr:hypothetical protein [Deltaproteobacteria bacterium]
MSPLSLEGRRRPALLDLGHKRLDGLSDGQSPHVREGVAPLHLYAPVLSNSRPTTTVYGKPIRSAS